MKGDFSEVTYGYCKCGCGNKTRLSRLNDAGRGYVKGEPMNFLPGHHVKPKFGKDNPMYGRGRFGKDNPMYGKTGNSSPLYGKTGKGANAWKSGRTIEKCKHTSYCLILSPLHPRSKPNGYVYEHILVAEKMNGGALPDVSIVHHIDKNGLNNSEDNLMVFPGVGEHMKFHALLTAKIFEEKND